MTKLSLRKLPKEKISQLNEQLFISFTKFHNVVEIALFIKDLLTRTEIEMFAKRLEVIKLYLKGFKYKEISKKLNVSEVTISKLIEKYLSAGYGFKILLGKIPKKINKKSSHMSSKRAALEFWRTLIN